MNSFHCITVLFVTLSMTVWLCNFFQVISFSGCKRSGCEADHSPPTSSEVKEYMELYLHSPSTSSWRDAQLKHGDNFTFTFTFNSHGIYIYIYCFDILETIYFTLTLGSQVRILLGAWMCVRVFLCCVVLCR
jgi:hypothetical protein